MRRPYVIGEAVARPDQNGKDERRHARGQMHHETSGEIQHPLGHEPAAAPNPMGDRHIDKDQQQRREQEHRGEPHALGEGADDQRRRDDGEGRLEHEEYGLGDLGIRIRRVAANSKQQDLVEITEPRRGTAEGEAVGPEQPEHRD